MPKAVLISEEIDNNLHSHHSLPYREIFASVSESQTSNLSTNSEISSSQTLVIK